MIAEKSKLEKIEEYNNWLRKGEDKVNTTHHAMYENWLYNPQDPEERIAIWYPATSLNNNYDVWHYSPKRNYCGYRLRNLFSSLEEAQDFVRQVIKALKYQQVVGEAPHEQIPTPTNQT